jgi:uncharacterized protein with NRDE domain
MCLVVLSWRVARDHRLLLGANRDEFHARPTAPLHRWAAPPMLAGRDLAAGGTWLGAHEDGRFAVVTNVREGRAAPPAGAPSRGELIPAFFAGGRGPREFLEALAADGTPRAGFTLLLGDARELACWSNVGGEAPRTLAPGTYALANGPLDAPWPKARRARAALEGLVAAGAPTPDALLDLLADRTPAADDELPDTGVGPERERFLSSAFIVGPAYGTRSTTALTIDAAGRLAAVERTYAPDGRATGARRFDGGALAA